LTLRSQKKQQQNKRVCVIISAIMNSYILFE